VPQLGDADVVACLAERVDRERRHLLRRLGWAELFGAGASETNIVAGDDYR
jgi:hypothetical protein